MLRITVAGVAAVAVGALAGLILSPEASVETAHSIVTIDTSTTSPALMSVPSSDEDATEPARNTHSSVYTKPPARVREVIPVDVPPADSKGQTVRHKSAARSTPAGIPHRRRGAEPTDDD
jgi:hypothetical protein